MKRIYTTAALGSVTLGLCALGLDHEALAQSRDIWGNAFRFGYQQPNLIHVRAGVITLFGLAGFVLGWLLSPQAAPLRIALVSIVAGITVLVALVNNGPLGWGLTPFVALAAFLSGLGYWLGQRVSAFAKRLSETPTTFGSAAWATFKDIMEAGYVSASGFRLGQVRDELGATHDFSYASDRHGFLFGPTRSHKGTSVIIPNLLTYEGSVLVIDPKGENAMITAEHRQAMEQDVYVIDPWGITGMDSAQFNPLEWLEPGDMDIVDNAMLLTDALMIQTSEQERFWDETAKPAFVGLKIHVATDPEFEGRRHFGTLRDLLMLDGDNLKKLFTNMLKSPHPVVRSTASRFLQMEERLLSNVLATMQAQTGFLDSPKLRENLSRSDFRFEDLKSGKVSIYLCLPADKLVSHGRWLRLLIQQAITVNARNIEDKPDQPVMIILDELPALGKLSSVEQAFGLMAGFGIQMLGVAQNAGQLKAIYGDGWETFIANAGVIQYFGSRDQFTADYISKLCGVTTIWDWSTAVARAVGVSRGKDTTHSTTNTSTETVSGKQRQLAYADELMRMGSDKQLVLIENHNPIIAEKRPWFEDPDLKTRGVNLHAKGES